MNLAKFKIGDHIVIIGQPKIYGAVVIIDMNGTFEDNSQIYYDIWSEHDNMLYKHIPENIMQKYNESSSN